MAGAVKKLSILGTCWVKICREKWLKISKYAYTPRNQAEYLLQFLDMFSVLGTLCCSSHSRAQEDRYSELKSHNNVHKPKKWFSNPGFRRFARYQRLL